MTHEYESLIHENHQNRLAVVYVRTARVTEAPDEVASVERQRAQGWHARAWGWSGAAIQVIEDLGQSGVAIDGRSGLHRLCGLIAAGQVGLVLVSDMARLSQSWRDLLTILRRCQKTDVLLAVDGRLVDLVTIFLLDSSPAQSAVDAGGLAFQRREAECIREIFRRYAGGATLAEIVKALNNGGLTTTGPA